MMGDALTAATWIGLVGLLAGIGYFVGSRSRAAVVTVLERELQGSREQERIATDRLLNAWRDDKIVPAPRPVDRPPPLDPLPSELLAEIEQYEDPEHRADMSARFRQKMSQGKSATAILLEEDNRHP